MGTSFTEWLRVQNEEADVAVAGILAVMRGSPPAPPPFISPAPPPFIPTGERGRGTHGGRPPRRITPILPPLPPIIQTSSQDGLVIGPITTNDSAKRSPEYWFAIACVIFFCVIVGVLALAEVLTR